MKKFFLLSFLLVAIPLSASHIVGGEFELIHLNGYSYQLNLIYYFDEKDGDQGNKVNDRIIHVKIFRSVDGVLMEAVDIPFVSESLVAYYQPACADGRIRTSRQYYSTVIALVPARYNDPQGYYVVWERCCRNYRIKNIFSEEGFPNTSNPNSAGQTFYLKFPPVTLNGEPFVNSSPHLFPPLRDYGCPGKPYFVNFAGTDDDGDSLSYTLVTPFDTQNHLAYPPVGPAPYPDVKWKDGYSLLNIMGGNPDLNISRDGLLRVTPMDTGLFVFAVKIEEFRNNIKIGEMRRDFQLFVAQGCEPDRPPLIVAKKLTDDVFSYVDNMSVGFSNTVSDENRCIEVQVSDPDSQDPAHNDFQNITIKAVALNFKNKDITGILPSVTNATLVNGGTASFTVCFPACPFINAPYQIGLVAYDAACPLPLTDTLKVVVNTQPPFNSNAYFLSQKKITDQLNEGSSRSWPFVAKDNDGDNLTISVIPDGFTLEEAGMIFKILNQQPGLANGELDWSAVCKKYEFARKSAFVVRVLVDDQDKCNNINYDTAQFNLSVLLPNINPKLRIYDEAGSQDMTGESTKMHLGHIGFDVVGTDTDITPIDTLNLSLLSITGDAPADGYSFANATGLHEVDSKFLWDPTCGIFKDTTYTNNYTLKFLVQNNHCKTPKTDTAAVKLTISDVVSTDKNFVPANVITTPADHCNDFFAIDGFESEPPCNGQVRQIPFAPVDNCSNRFEQVKIYDRWGKKVFESSDRKFRWYASSEAAGVYYCIIDFTRNQYKNSITVIH